MYIAAYVVVVHYKLREKICSKGHILSIIVSVLICHYFLDFNKSQNAKMHKETTSDASRARLQILGKYEDI